MMVHRNPDDIEEIPADMVILCTGNETAGWENIVQYTPGGYVDTVENQKVPEFDNLYVGGWARTGSKGIINTSIDEANFMARIMGKVPTLR